MSVDVSDARSHGELQIARAAQVIGKSEHRRKVFEAIYRGQKKSKTVAELAAMTNLPMIRVFQESAVLANNYLVRKSKIGKDLAYTKDPFFSQNKNRVLTLTYSKGHGTPNNKPTNIANKTNDVKSPKKLKSFPRSVANRRARTASGGKRVFIVHGHDDTAKYELARILDRDLGLEPIILHEQANRGKTIIEKLEDNSDVGFAFVILTPDDIGGQDRANLMPRARQNVVFELGYFLGILGRENVCCLYKRGLQIPSDINGLIYASFSHNIGECYREIRRELGSAGYVLRP
jgi:predicted nucleotide-binding protein